MRQSTRVQMKILFALTQGNRKSFIIKGNRLPYSCRRDMHNMKEFKGENKRHNSKRVKLRKANGIMSAMNQQQF